jgi:hypothetical protein
VVVHHLFELVLFGLYQGKHLLFFLAQLLLGLVKFAELLVEDVVVFEKLYLALTKQGFLLLQSLIPCLNLFLLRN